MLQYFWMARVTLLVISLKFTFSIWFVAILLIKIKVVTISSLWSSVLLTTEFLPNFDLKKRISTYTKDCSWENGHNPMDFWFCKSPATYDKFQVGSWEYKNSFLFISSLVCNQIWIIFFLVDHHLATWQNWQNEH